MVRSEGLLVSGVPFLSSVVFTESVRLEGCLVDRLT